VLEHFSATFRRGEWVLIGGDPAVTSRFFKVLAGLWPWGTGRVLLPAGGRVLFVPQRPFLPEGTLRDALCYPSPASAFPDEVIRQALECAGTRWLVPRLDAADNWEQSLPQRAQQRLGLARVLMQRPDWVLLEEATDAFDPEGERVILGRLRERLPGTTVLTISFNPGLEALHDRKIVLTRAGG
jgi:putative ATP-binding cassette transporter